MFPAPILTPFLVKKCATQTHEFLGLFHLFKLFQTRFCFEPDKQTLDPFGFRCIPKTNDFSDLGEYFLKKVSLTCRLSAHLYVADCGAKTLITAISMVRDGEGQTPPVVLQFLVDLLAYNDNMGNKVCIRFVSWLNAYLLTRRNSSSLTRSTSSRS